MRVFEAVACESSKGLTIYIGPSFFFFRVISRLPTRQVYGTIKSNNESCSVTRG